ncbi:hypothetical protein ACG04Q_19210 [Roseateles sp. DXS20W]|uniref:DUF2489 domain-containing protein n=1 Tax=Pelomonas lactea TaxID=3299030 RepID=A0ABW7GP25_9BURK
MRKLSWQSVLFCTGVLVALGVAILFGFQLYRDSQQEAQFARTRDLELQAAKCLDEHLSPAGAQRVADLLDRIPTLFEPSVKNAAEARRLAMRVVGTRCPRLFQELYTLQDSSVTEPTEISMFWQAALAASYKVDSLRKAAAADAALSVAKKSADAQENGITRELERRGDESWLTR